MAKSVIIKASALYKGGERLADRRVVVEGERIAEVSAWSGGKADYEGVVTAGFVDAHSHIGMFREGEPQAEAEGNDKTAQIMPLSDPLNSIYFDDRAFQDAVDFGVLYSCVVPGSGNLIGGKARVIRNFAKNRKDALASDYGYKMALGYNPRSTTEWKGERPDTRMGVYQLLEKKLDEVVAKKARSDLALERSLRELARSAPDKGLGPAELDRERAAAKREAELGFTSEESALLDLLSGRKTVKVHVHKEDDVLYLIELRKRYGFKATADHLGDVHHKEIFDELAKAEIPIIYGPLGSLAYKVELKHEDWRNTGLLMKSKASYGLMTDHPVILSYQLRDSLKYFLIHGMSDAQAIRLVTEKNAELLGLGDQIGMVAEDRLASLVVWDKEPLHLGAMPRMVMAEGAIVRKRS
jgi:imidazolonepropionase-like amidohydrolase